MLALYKEGSRIGGCFKKPTDPNHSYSNISWCSYTCVKRTFYCWNHLFVPWIICQKNQEEMFVLPKDQWLDFSVLYKMFTLHFVIKISRYGVTFMWRLFFFKMYTVLSIIAKTFSFKSAMIWSIITCSVYLIWKFQ